MHKNGKSLPLIKKESTFKRAWDMGIILSAIYATLTSTIHLAWEDRNPFGVWYNVLEYIIFIAYIVDVFLMLITIYTDPNGNKITDHKKIARHYLMSLQFVIDILSLLSNPATAQIPGKTGKYIKLFAILKVQRYFRIATIIADSDQTQG